MNDVPPYVAEGFAKIRDELKRRQPPREPDRATPAGEPAQPLPTTSAAMLAGLALPVREFLDSASLLPMRNVVLLSGDGGLGKSLLAMQLALACSTASQWIGIDVASGPVVYLSAEEDQNETHIRLVEICAAEGIDLAEAHTLEMIFLAGQDAVLAFEGNAGARLQPTPLYKRLAATLDAISPVLLVVDNLADVFSGNENNRSIAKHFVGILRGLAIRYDCTVLLLGHPSLSGRNSGTGESGSTAWSNSVRARLYLTTYKDNGNEEGEIDPDSRWLKSMKANYAPLAEPISLRWQKGRFVRTDAKSPFDGVTAQHLEAVRRAFDEQEWKYDVQSPTWGGYCVATLLKLDVGQGLKQHDRSKAQKLALMRIRGILATWMRNGQIGIVERHVPERGRTVKFFCSKGI